MPVLSSGSSHTRLEVAIGYEFTNKSLFLEALTHRTYSHEFPERAPAFNERLEFLGDAVLGLLIGEELFRRCPRLSEGSLSKIKAGLVRDRTLARVAEGIRLGEYILLGRGEEQTGGRKRSSLLANALEALLAAVYLDSGLESARQVLGRIFEAELLEDPCQKVLSDSKTALQEVCHQRFQSGPEYRVVREEGPDHAKVFHVEVYVQGTRRAVGKGPNKKEAEQQAARQALDGLTQQP